MGIIMQGIKKKKYSSPPTYKQINSILCERWKLTSINSVNCLNGGIVSIENDDKYLFLFEQCQEGEEYYCLQRFVYYSLWSQEQYQQAMKEIEEYKNQGAYIISTYSIEATDSVGDKVIVPPLLSTFPEASVDIIYYIIIPRKYVMEQDERCSYDEMLKCLGAFTYANTYYNIHFLIVAISFLLMALWKESGYIYICLLIGFFIYLLSSFSNIQYIYYFFRYRLYRKEYSWKTLKNKL